MPHSISSSLEDLIAADMEASPTLSEHVAPSGTGLPPFTPEGHHMSSSQQQQHQQSQLHPTSLTLSERSSAIVDMDISEISPDAYTPRRSMTQKRREDPPRNDDNKMICQYPECVGITFDRKCEWG